MWTTVPRFTVKRPGLNSRFRWLTVTSAPARDGSAAMLAAITAAIAHKAKPAGREVQPPSAGRRSFDVKTLDTSRSAVGRSARRARAAAKLLLSCAADPSKDGTDRRASPRLDHRKSKADQGDAADDETPAPGLEPSLARRISAGCDDDCRSHHENQHAENEKHRNSPFFSKGSPSYATERVKNRFQSSIFCLSKALQSCALNANMSLLKRLLSNSPEFNALLRLRFS